MVSKKLLCQQVHCVMCENEQENQRTLFAFPKSPERKKKWLNILKIEETKLKYRSRVCDRHFDKSQLIRTRLVKGAIPTLNPSKITTVPNFRPPKFVKILPKTSLGDVLNGNQQEIKLDKIERSFFKKSKVGSIHEKTNDERLPSTVQFNGTLTGPSVSPSPSQIILLHTASISDESKSHAACRRKINQMRYSLKNARKKARNGNPLKTIFEGRPLLLEILEAQIERFRKPRLQYSSFEKSLALSLFYACGNNGYRLLCSFLELPRVRTMRRWTESLHVAPGIQQNLMETLEHVTKNLTSKERDCVLVWDEMSIKELIEYNAGSDQLEGIVDLGSQGRRLSATNEALVFMAQGINVKWKFPVSFYFSSSATKAEHLQALVLENITKLEQIGLRVRMGICDMAFTNQSLYKSWEITEEKPYMLFNSKRVYLVHDSPHLIKLVRNNLMKYDFYLKRFDGVKWLNERVRWLHVLSFFNKDRRLTTRMAPKLTTCHIFLKDFSKMKVKLATQVLSKSVYAGIMAMVQLKILKPEAKHTALFIKHIDDLFDLLNISKYSDDKPTRCAKDMFDNFQRFDDHLAFLKTIEIPKYPIKNPQFLSGLKITLKGIKMLCLDLQWEGYQHVHTRQLQQDCLENFFSAIRMKGGFSKNPSAKQFRSNFKYLFLARLLKNPITGNTEGNHHNFESLLEKIEKLRKKSVTTSDDLSTDTVVENKSFYRKLTNRQFKFGKEQERCVISYFGPACVSAINEKNNFTRCAAMLNSIENCKVTDLNYFSQQAGCKSLSFLENNTLSTFLFLNQHFDKYANESLSSDATRVVRGIIDKFLEQDTISNWLNDKCKEHKLEIVKYFIRTKMYRLVKDKNEQIKKPKAWDQTRRELRNQ